MKNIKLSICIPTYNRAKFLDEAIESVVSQITEDIKDKLELCISDNASTDNTEEIVEKWKKQSSISIIYHKNEENLGADRNFLKVVEIANGEYCWYLGSDDAVEKNSIVELLNIIQSTKHDFYLLTQNCYSPDLKNKFNCNHHPLLNYKGNKLLSINDITSDAIYLLGYLSALIVKKNTFMSIAPLEDKYIGSMYVHTYKIIYAIKMGASIFYIRQPMVKWRSGNDSFLDELKIYGRIKIDIEGYSSIAKDVFGYASNEYRKVVKIRVINKIARYVFVLKLNNILRKDIMALFQCIKPFRLYYLKAYVLSFTPKFIAKLIRYIYRLTLKKY